ncbi:MAG: hypothetical protein JW867_03140 [Candidatus Omnitrophica bacterium]|nr:hypothetical protein [Candidatus Omnitrophota bacterium]
MKKFLSVVLVLIFLTGCSTVAGITHRFEKIDYSDGINEVEAVIIAQHHLISSEHKDHYVSSFPEIIEKDDYWVVAFTFRLTSSFSRNYARTWYSVYVDKKSGEVIDYAIYKGTGVGWGMREDK